MPSSCTPGARRRSTSETVASAVALLACLAAGGAALAPGSASARTTPSVVARSAAVTTVTIKAQGLDLSGTVTSKRQGCVTDRMVSVIKQIGTRGGGDDRRFGSDLASADGSWETGNTGVAGRVYAKAKATSTCAADTSPTIRITR
jgi:hypothetical protein